MNFVAYDFGSWLHCLGEVRLKSGLKIVPKQGYFSAYAGFAQFGVSIHQSNIPFAGFNYQIGERFLPELRFGIDNNFDNISIEATVSYLIVKKEDFDFYGGLGARTTILEGLVVPVGLNIYPFERKNFGFQMELAAMSGEENVLRGSWGIRYRFSEKE